MSSNSEDEAASDNSHSESENPDESEVEEDVDEEQELDLDASATDTDEDEDDDDDDDDEDVEDEDGEGEDEDVEDEGEEDEDEEDDELEQPVKKTAAEIIEEKIQGKYEQIKGTRLYVRFAKKLPADEKEFNAKVKALSPLITTAHRPRQKHARFCLVDFKSKEDRDTALDAIKSAIKSNESDVFKGLFVSLPKTESDEFVSELVARKQQSLETKKTKSLMKRATKKVQRKESFTSSIVIINLPKTTSVAQVRKLFENAVDIQIKPGKGKFRESTVATVTLPTTHEARLAVKKEVSIGGTALKLRFDSQRPRKRPKKNVKRKVETKGESEEVPAKKKKAKSAA